MSKFLNTSNKVSSRNGIAVAALLALAASLPALNSAKAETQGQAQAVSSLPADQQQQILATYGDCVKANPTLWNASYEDLVRACTPAAAPQPAPASYAPPAYAPPAPQPYYGGYGYNRGRGNWPVTNINIITTGHTHCRFSPFSPGCRHPLPTPTPKTGNCGINPHASPCNLPGPQPLPNAMKQIPAGQLGQQAQIGPLGQIKLHQRPPFANQQQRFPIAGLNPMLNRNTTLPHMHRPFVPAQTMQQTQFQRPFVAPRPMMSQRPMMAQRPVMSRQAHAPVRMASAGMHRRR